MTKRNRNVVYRLGRIMILVWAAILLVLCGTPTPNAQERAAVAIDYDVRRERDQVKAHIEGLSTTLAEADLVTLSTSSWNAMLDHGRVATDEVGRAELRAECTPGCGCGGSCRCEAVVLYEGSHLVARPCHPEQAAGICATGQGLLSNCDICFETVSARTCPTGTWVSLSYLGESEVTLVTVGEGSATVTPVTVLDYAETAPLEFEFATLECGEPVTLTAERIPRESGAVNLVYFLYTAPRENLERIAATADELGIRLPPAGVPLPADQLPSLVDPEFGLPRVLDRLEWAQPNLQLWMHDLSQSAFERGGMLFPPFAPPYQGLNELSVLADGQLLANEYVHQAVQVAAQEGGLEYTTPSGGLSPGVVEDSVLVILYPADDSELAGVAQVLYDQLVERGFLAEVQGAVSGEVLSVEPDGAVLYLGRR